MAKPCYCFPGQTLPSRCSGCPFWKEPLREITVERRTDKPHQAMVTVDGRTHCELWDSAKAVLDYQERHKARGGTSG